MRNQGGLALVLVLMAFGAALIVGGCSSKDKGTNPPASTTMDSFDSGTMGGTPFTHTFNTAGTFGYRCKFHSAVGMTGTVTVDDNAANTTASVTVGQGGSVFTPASVTVKTGGTVTWTLSAGTHTVTRP
jgi:plastocyanin